MATKKRKTSRKRTNNSTYSRTNAPKRPARVRSPQDMARDKEIMGIILIALAILLLIGFFLAPDPSEADSGVVGVISLFFIKTLRFFAGSGAIALPIFLLLFGIFICSDREHPSKGRLIGLFLIFLAVLGLLQLSAKMTVFQDYVAIAAAGTGGGVIGALLTFAFMKTIGHVGAIIFYIAMLLIGLLLAFQTSLSELSGELRHLIASLRELIAFKQGRGIQAKAAEKPASEPKHADLPRKVPILGHEDPAPVISEERETNPALAPPPKTKFVLEYMPDISETKAADAPSGQEEIGERPHIMGGKSAFVDAEEKEISTAGGPNQSALHLVKEPGSANKEGSSASAFGKQVEKERTYVLPPVELIEPGMRIKSSRMSRTITENIGILEATLESFGVKATVTQVVAGPSVTRFELQPAPGVKVAKITSLSDDIALSLAAQGVRIEAPIPGKSAIGIEVARKERDTVHFREMIESEEFQNSKAKLSFALGKNIGGESIIGDLSKMPHLLIAGSTGSGKSVCLNTIICSLLYKATPDEVKIMLIDPKKVEMTQYTRLPHLIAPVVNDSKKAANALKWVVNEMENRYSLFVGAGCKDFDGHNKVRPEAPIPHIVVIIDELADLMMVARHEVEDSICRLAQMARAAGIHLVIATQRPSVDVITGLIKANIPSRIAFAVSSYTDSRTILDMGGAEKLLGNGDMLYAPLGRNKPERIQGTFIHEKDVNRLVGYCSEQACPSFSEAAVKAAVEGEKIGEEKMEDADELLYDAAMLIISTGQASTSFLQRRLAIGNPRAARIMDMLEAKGVVGGPNGSKPRDVLMTAEEVDAMYGN